jgi:hypothetical protein
MSNLAIRYSDAGRRNEALEMSETVWKLRKGKLGEDHPDTLKSMNNLAIDYSDAGRRTEALQLTAQVVELRKNKLGEDHPDTRESERLLAHLNEKAREGLPKSSIGVARHHRMSKLWRKVRS